MLKTGKVRYNPNYLVIQKLDIDGELDRELIYKVKDFGFPHKWIPYHFMAEDKQESTTFLFYTKENAAFLNVEIGE